MLRAGWSRLASPRSTPESGMVQSDACSFCSNALAATGRQAPASELLYSLLLTASYLLLSCMEREARRAPSVTVTSACTGDHQRIPVSSLIPERTSLRRGRRGEGGRDEGKGERSII